MTGAETIERAIKKLEGLRKARGYQEVNGWLVEESGYTVQSYLTPDESFSPVTNDYLFLVLHRTIDAQLAVLRHVAAHYSGDLGIGTNRHVVALAESILGDDS